MELPSGESVGTILLVVVLLFSVALALFALAKSRGWVGGEKWDVSGPQIAPPTAKEPNNTVR